VRQIEHTQWSSLEAIRVSQRNHLKHLARHSLRSSPHFAERFTDGGLSLDDLNAIDWLSALAPITRRDFQRAGPDFFCRTVPTGHGAVEETITSGTTGEPVAVRSTAVTRLFWHAMAMRQVSWHRRNADGRLCTVNPRHASRELRNDWGPPVTWFSATGPSMHVPLSADIAQVCEWVADFDPTFLVAYPSVLAALVHRTRRHGLRLPSLEQVLTIGEVLHPHVRADARAALGATVTDLYSAQEFGHIALECPVTGLYHVMAESLLVEVLEPDGRPTAPGDIGRVVVTDLHNYAAPLIRYELGDYAQVGPPCACRRGLPTLNRIVGRVHNLLRMPDGSHRWPLVGLVYCREVAPVVQYQFVQRDETTIDIRLVVERPLSGAEEEALRALVHRWIGFPFTLQFEYFDEHLPAGPTHKLADVICHLP
jgi:phenylacetate-CoA ligase